MADNFETSAASGGAVFVGASFTYSGDAGTIIPGVYQLIMSGGEGSWAGVEIVGGAGAVTGGVQRVTLASDDPAVVDLAAIEVLLTGIDADTDAIKTATQLIDNAVSGAGFNVTQLAGAAVPIGAGVEATALRVTLATDSTGVVSIDDNGGAITVDGTVAVTGMTACDTGAVVIASGTVPR